MHLQDTFNFIISCLVLSCLETFMFMAVNISGKNRNELMILSSHAFEKRFTKQRISLEAEFNQRFTHAPKTLLYL